MLPAKYQKKKKSLVASSISKNFLYVRSEIDIRTTLVTTNEFFFCT
jgi:hypothetical protein